VAQYEGTTETVLFDLFECGLFPYTPVINEFDANMPISFIFGDRDWVDSIGAEVVITRLRQNQRIADQC
jgi:hypothetical protein